VARQKSTHVDSAKAVGERIRRARLDAGLRQRDLAFQGCTPAYISRVEAGARIPSLQLLEEIGRRLGVSAVFLARGGAPSRERLDLADAQLAQRLGEVDEAREIFLRLTSSSDDSGAWRDRPRRRRDHASYRATGRARPTPAALARKSIRSRSAGAGLPHSR
jgi:transcriptional regulator with XRE-family HTH domain